MRKQNLLLRDDVLPFVILFYFCFFISKIKIKINLIKYNNNNEKISNRNYLNGLIY